MRLWGPVLVLALCVAAATALPVFQFVADTSELLPMCRALAPVASNEAAAQCAALPLALGSDPCALKCTTEAIERGYACSRVATRRAGGSPRKLKSADPDVFLLAPALREPSIGHAPEPASPNRPTHHASRYQPCSALCLDRTTLHVERGTNVKAPVSLTGRMSSGGNRVRCALPEELPERVKAVLRASWQLPFLFAPSDVARNRP